MDQSIIRKEDLEKIWSDGKQNPKELPITITIFPIPGFGINTEAVRKTIMSAFSNKQLTEKTKILTVKECIEKILSGELKREDNVWVSALCSEVIPSRVIYYPSVFEKEKIVELTVGKGSAAFTRAIGREFFSGSPCYHIYLTEIDWGQAYFLKTYFPSSSIGTDFLGMLNNCGVVIYGELEKTSIDYPCLRNDKVKDNTTISEFTGKCTLGLKAKVVYRSKVWNILSYVEKIDGKTTYQRAEHPQDYSVYWLNGRGE
jgi:hypothetical protein